MSLFFFSNIFVRLHLGAQGKHECGSESPHDLPLYLLNLLIYSYSLFFFFQSYVYFAYELFCVWDLGNECFVLWIFLRLYNIFANLKCFYFPPTLNMWFKSSWYSVDLHSDSAAGEFLTLSNFSFLPSLHRGTWKSCVGEKKSLHPVFHIAFFQRDHSDP